MFHAWNPPPISTKGVRKPQKMLINRVFRAPAMVRKMIRTIGFGVPRLFAGEKRLFIPGRFGLFHDDEQKSYALFYFIHIREQAGNNSKQRINQPVFFLWITVDNGG